MNSVKKSVGSQRLNDYKESTGLGTISHTTLSAAKLCLKMANQDGNSNLKLGNDNHFSNWAIPAVILYVLAFEVFLNEIISSLCIDNLITSDKKKSLGKKKVRENFKSVRRLLRQDSSFEISSKELEDLELIVELRNDLVHHLPRNIYNDSVSKKLDALGLLVPNNVMGNKLASFKLSVWVSKTVATLANSFVEDIDSLSESKRAKAFFTSPLVTSLRDNFVSSIKFE